jgi:hypothetical protein
VLPLWRENVLAALLRKENGGSSCEGLRVLRPGLGGIGSHQQRMVVQWYVRKN